jgi:hypothetical protein
MLFSATLGTYLPLGVMLYSLNHSISKRKQMARHWMDQEHNTVVETERNNPDQEDEVATKSLFSINTNGGGGDKLKVNDVR